MLEIKSNEAKTIYFDLAVEGIEKNLLSGKFRLLVNDIEYGFPCEIKDDKIKVTIPALENVLVEGTMGTFKGKLEIIGDSKYYIMPWEGSVDLKIEPKVVVKPDPIHEEVKQDVKIKAYLTSGPVVEIETKAPRKAGKSNPALRNKLI